MIYNDCINKWRTELSEDLISTFFLKFTYCTNKIINDETRLRDVEIIFKGEEVVNFKEDMKTINEIKTHRELCRNLLELIKVNNLKLSVDLVKYCHKFLRKDCFNIELLDEKVEKKLEILIKEINNVRINETNALKVISYFVCNFESVQNSFDRRIGRVLMNYLLIGNNLAPIIIYYNDIEQYNLALEYFRKTKNTSKMVIFLEQEALNTWLKNYNLKTKTLKDFL